MLEYAAKAVTARAAVTVDYKQAAVVICLVLWEAEEGGAVAAGSVRRWEIHLFAMAGRTSCWRYQPRVDVKNWEKKKKKKQESKGMAS